MIAYLSPVVGGKVEDDGILIDVGGAEPMSLKSEIVVNSVGLQAQQLALKIEGLSKETVPPFHYFKGNYNTHSGRPPFSRPVFTVPEKAGLGVHVTVDLAGQVKFGPDVEWIDQIDYDVDPARADLFYDAVRRYYPDLKDGSIMPGYAGIRPKIQAPGEPAKDFLIQGPRDHGVDGLVNLYGIESPGLTASMPIADHVVDLLGVI